MFFVIISISIYIFGIYLILVLSNCNAIQSTDCHVWYFNKLSIYLDAESPIFLFIVKSQILIFDSDKWYIYIFLSVDWVG